MTKSICEEKIFDTVFMSHSEHLRNFIYYKSGDLHRSEDIMQDAFGKLWVECAKVPFEKAKSFLFTIANNLFLNQEKHKKVILKFQKQITNKTHTETPEFILEEAEFEKRLNEAIQALSEGQREVFLLNRIDKLTYREIAESLDISVKAVEKRMHKALTYLRKISKKV